MRKEDPLIATLSETNNTYRTLISCFVCASVYKACATIDKICMGKPFAFFQGKMDWIILVSLVLLFALSYVKQTSYVRKRVESIINRANAKDDRKS